MRFERYRIAIIDQENETQKKMLEKFMMRRVHAFRRGADACGAHRRDSSVAVSASGTSNAKVECPSRLACRYIVRTWQY